MQAEFVPFWNSTWKERIFENICCTMVGYDTSPPSFNQVLQEWFPTRMHFCIYTVASQKFWPYKCTWSPVKKLYSLLLWIRFNYLKATEPLRGRSLLFTIKFSETPGSHLIHLGRMKVWVDLRATQWFWTRDLWIGNPAP